jgi:hypothetical protein
MGDAGEFSVMYRRWWDVVFEAAEGVLHSEEDARDAAQRVFARLWLSGEWRRIEDPERFFRYELGGEGDIVRAYGASVHPSSRELARAFEGQSLSLLTQGSISCDRVTARLLYVSVRLGEMRMYHLDGRLEWRVMLTAFHRGEMTRSHRFNACCVLRPNAVTKTTHTAVHVILRGERAYVSVREWRPGRAPPVAYETRVISARNGQEVGREAAAMAIVGAVGSELSGFAEPPTPRVVVGGMSPGSSR